MDDGRLGGRLSLVGRPLGPAFERRIIEVAPHTEHWFDGSAWQDTLIVVEHGEIELESLAGTRVTFPAGAVLFLRGLPLRAIRNRGRIPVALSLVARRRRRRQNWPTEV